MSTQAHPQARHDGLVVRELPDEVLVYDLEQHEAHCLNATSAAVWRHCDGESSPSEIGFRLAREFGTPVDEEVVWLALEQLSERGLLAEAVVRPAGLSRKQVVRRGALVAAAIALPVTASVVAPNAAQAVTCFCGAGCTSSQQCCFNCPTCTSNNCV